MDASAVRADESVLPLGGGVSVISKFPLHSVTAPNPVRLAVQLRRPNLGLPKRDAGPAPAELHRHRDGGPRHARDALWRCRAPS